MRSRTMPVARVKMVADSKGSVRPGSSKWVGAVLMTGPAVTVFEGEIDLAAPPKTDPA